MRRAWEGQAGVAEGFPRRQDQFQVLPFRRLPGGGIERNDKQASWPGYPKPRLAILLGLDRLLEVNVDVVNLSFGFREPYNAEDPLQIATHFAVQRGVPVVVAAGNYGPRENTLQALARASWVISVGATDCDGLLYRKSSRGSATGSCPTVVAPGATLDDTDHATSYATPRVSKIVALTQKCLELSLSNLRDRHAGQWTAYSSPIRLAIIGVADTGLIPDKVPHNSTAAAIWKGGRTRLLSRTERERAWYEALLRWLREAGVHWTATLDVSAVKRALQLMARPLPRYAKHQVGWGFVGTSEVTAFFQNVLPSIWLRIFCPNVISDDKQVTALADLDERLGPLWDTKAVSQLKILFYDSQKFWSVRIGGTAEENNEL